MNIFRKYLNEDLGVAAIVFAFSIPMIIGSAGVGVDVAKGYHTKNKLEKTLDAAALAAASSGKKGEDLEDFIADYVKNNFRENDYSKIDLSKIAVDHDPDTRRIEIIGEATTNNTFMKMLPFAESTTTVSARSVSQKTLSGVEVALVLDNSESMKFDGRIDDLKDAAEDFVDTLYDSADKTGGQFKIGIVPYGSFVNVGPYGLGYGANAAFVKNPDGVTYTTSRSKSDPNWSGCVFEHDLFDDKDDHVPDWSMYKKCYDPDNNKITKGSHCSATKKVVDKKGYETTCTKTGTKTCTKTVDGVEVEYSCAKKTCKKTCLTASCKHTYKYVSKSAPNIHDYCIKTVVQPLIKNSETDSKSDLKDAISNLNAETHQKTHSDIAMAWAYHLLSPDAPFREGEKYSSSNWQKVIVFMTDGKIEGDFYGPYYGKENNTSKITKKAQERFTDMCDKSKAKGTLIYTVQFGSIGDTALLTDCATDTTKALKASSGTDLQKTFVAIAEDLGNIFLAE